MAKQKVKYIMDLYHCQNCGGVLENTKEYYMTEAPIEFILECPVCHEKHFMLTDNVLCTESEYNKRIHKHYNCAG